VILSVVQTLINLCGLKFYIQWLGVTQPTTTSSQVTKS